MRAELLGCRSGISQERLEIEKLLDRKNAPNNNDFDELFDEIHQTAITNKLASPPSEPDTSVSADDSAEEEIADDASDDQTETTDADVIGTESFSRLHEPALEEFLLQEQIYYDQTMESLFVSQEWDDGSSTIGTIGDAAGAIGSMAYRTLIRGEDGRDGLLTKLSKLGFTYGKVGLQKLSKGIFYALSQSAAAIISGSKLLVRTLRKRQKSYQRLSERIQKARSVLEVIDRTPLKDADISGLTYTDQVAISLLKVGADTNFLTHLRQLSRLMEIYDGHMARYVAGCVGSTRSLINQVMSGQVEMSLSTYIDEYPLKEMRRVSTGELTETLQAGIVLPGDKLLMVDTPRTDLTEYQDVKDAYHQARTYISINSKTHGVKVAECAYLDVSEMAGYLDLLENICQHGMRLENTFKQVEGYRRQLKPSIGSYIDYLVAHQRDLTIRESLAELVSLKVAYMDQVVVGGHLRIHDQVITSVSAALDYVRDSMEVRVH